MTSCYRVTHAIAYRFAQTISGAELDLRLTPSSGPGRVIHHHQIVCEPRPRRTSTREDAHGNVVQHVELGAGASGVSITAITTFELTPEMPELDFLSGLEVALAAAGVDNTPARLASAGLCRRRTERAIAVLDAAGFRCRYVAGYALPTATKRTLPHAWLAIEAPNGAWLEYNPTLASAASSHLRVAVGRTFDDVTAVTGQVAAEGAFRLVSSVDVEAGLPTPARSGQPRA